MHRTHTCGELRRTDIGRHVTLAGWLHRRRDHGGVIFVDLRDRYGLTQVTFRKEACGEEVYKQAESVRSEFVLQVSGSVVARPKEMVNPLLPSGEIELEATTLAMLSTAKTPVFEITGSQEQEYEVREEIRMKYRYLDLRRPRMRDNIVMRHRFVKCIRDVLDKQGFIEVETPVLTKSTPEGARDYLVPARLHPGLFYALPQSPQQYKQLLMVAGMDRYFQIARCMRDEDQRGDRQAEFTQLDLEMSFVERDDVLDLTEELFTQAVETLFPQKKFLKKPWPRLSYDDAMLKYGIDKPDLRFALEIQDVSEWAMGSRFNVFEQAVGNGGVVRVLVAPVASFSRKQLDDLEELVKKEGAKGLASITIKEDGSVVSPLTKFISKEAVTALTTTLGAKRGDVVFFGAGSKKVVCASLAALRSELGQRLKLKDPDLLAFAFVIDFPLFAPELENGNFAPSHHMFTSPRPQDLPLLESDPARARSWQYDFIGNGYELGGGSIRIHRRDIQDKIFQLIGFTPERRKMFSHMLEAFEYGAPPHGGIAPGIDRILMVLLGEPSIREVMAFPKTGDGRDLLMGAPSPVEPEQLKELHIKVIES